jgi:urease accessory protein
MLPVSLLAALQLGDSAFPSGAYTQSHGLETLVAEGKVTRASDVEAVLTDHLRHRLARADLPALLAAHRAAAAGDVVLLERIDDALTAVKMTREERQASTRMGSRVVAELERLAPHPILASRPAANAAVAFALAGYALGLDAREAALTYTYGFASSLVSASLRLMRIGHGETQAILRRSHPLIELAIDGAEAIPWDALRPFAPGLDLASARHERLPARLFAS